MLVGVQMGWGGRWNAEDGEWMKGGGSALVGYYLQCSEHLLPCRTDAKGQEETES